eukprot:CAMPEP_0114141636 /NCGR_PEP_ID=MMETSP0043_2-20121206/18016_1 /TAXON_ID=464988 /ORGANISM="Hemiselmis andersenii, Strain CCMP644" /LENGTH=194 /DNA_ID=CAMNT_0001235795 /DNA_START=151 /DNA_END=735 /DNA_ORIENTATION=-
MVATQRLKEAVAEAMETDLPEEEKALLMLHGPMAQAYPLEVVELLCKRLASRPFLHEILSGSSIATPPPLPRKTNPENQKRLAKIKRDLEEREYAEMVKDVRRSEIAAEEVGEVQTYKAQLGEGMSIIFSKATAFAIGYYASRTIHGIDRIHNIICGLVGLIVGLMVDGTLLVLRSASKIRDTESSSRTRMKND